MIKSNIYWIITCVITWIITFLLKDLITNWFMIPFFYIGALLLVNKLINAVSDRDFKLLEINKVKRVKHPQSNRYYFTITKTNLITLYRSHLFYNRYINFFYVSKEEANLEHIKSELNYYIQKDLPIITNFDDFHTDIDKWSGALSDELERDSKIKDILK